LIDRMQELLEAERAGVKCLSAMADSSPEGEKKDFLVFLRNDEGRFCAGLHRLIRDRKGTPTDRPGTFADKVLALAGEGAAPLSLGGDRSKAWALLLHGPGTGSAPSEGGRSLRRSPCVEPARLRSTFAGKLRSDHPPARPPPQRA